MDGQSDRQMDVGVGGGLGTQTVTVGTGATKVTEPTVVMGMAGGPRNGRSWL